MSERQKVAETTKALVNMFPEYKNDLEKKSIILSIIIILSLIGRKAL